jgi:protein TonB
MGYQALLFCPDDKTARTVTQVLGELEFAVESCTEPFAAVKKLMGAHFDAIVVDCDNEQNATLLFKSARNSTSNQASLAVAVVEGQAGVAKAFRIGANLVLTKPINVDQAKGTLRVARGLLRKSDPAKPAAPPTPVATTPVPAQSPAASAPAPAKIGPAATALPAKPSAPSALPAASVPRPVATPVAKPVTSPAWPAPAAAAAVAKTAPVVRNADTPEIKGKSVPPAPPATPVAPPAPKKVAAPVPASKLPAPARPTTPEAPVTQAIPAAAVSARPAFRGAPEGPVPAFGSAAASAPAPARQIEESPVAEAAPVVEVAPVVDATPVKAPHEAEALFEKPAEAAATAPSISDKPALTKVVAPEPSFSFSGTDLGEESSGGSKKIFLGIAASVLVVVGAYYAWTQFHGQATAPVSNPAPAVAAPQIPKPSSAQPVPAPRSTSPGAVVSQPAAQPVTDTAVPATDGEATEPGPDNPAPSSTKSFSSASSATGKASFAAKPAESPLVVKGGTAPRIKAASPATEAPAPSMDGIATPGSGGSLPNIVNNDANAFRPVLQSLNISQGVSSGLLVKKVQPTYPRNALSMHVEGAVQLMATISKAGEITTVKVVSGEPMLTRAAADAVKQWKYKPYLLNGEPVEIQTQITINFKLPH